MQLHTVLQLGAYLERAFVVLFCFVLLFLFFLVPFRFVRLRFTVWRWYRLSQTAKLIYYYSKKPERTISSSVIDIYRILLHTYGFVDTNERVHDQRMQMNGIMLYTAHCCAV